MSTIFGVFRRDGRPVEPDDLSLMSRAVAFPGTVPAAYWQGTEVGFGVSRRHPEDSWSDAEPLNHATTGIAVAAHVRLDNRRELCDQLGIASDEVTDTQVVLAAYLKWGEEFVPHLLGDWAIAVWDPRSRKVLLSRDHHGMTPLFYYADGSVFAFSTSILCLLALPYIPKRPDLLKVAQVMATWPSDGIMTAYEGISRVPSGHWLGVDPTTLEVKRYWQIDPETTLRFSSNDECVEAFSEIYTEAVRCRLRTSRAVGATLSGGLDSGSVCALAARELRERDLPLVAFTSVPMSSKEVFSGTHFGDETPFVSSHLEYAPNLKIHYENSEKVSPLSGIDRCLDLIQEPLHGASNLYWMIAIQEAAKGLNVGVLLTGQMGNATVSFTGGRDRSFSQRMRQQLLLSWAKPLRNYARMMASGGEEPWFTASPLRKSFAESIDLKRKRREAGEHPFLAAPAQGKAHQLKFLNMYLRVTGSALNETGPAHLQDVTDPTSDKRLMEFCTSIPPEHFYRDGYDRALVRQALKGIMPDKVRLSRRRGRQASDLGYRLLASLSEVQGALDGFEKHELTRDVLDIPKMRRVLMALESGVDVPKTNGVGAILMRGLMAGRYLERF